MLRREEASELSAAEAAADTDASPERREEDSELSAVDRDTSPDVLEEISELRAVERDTSPERREEASESTAVPTDVIMDVIVVWKLASSLRAAANSLSVSSAAGAPSMRFVIAVLMSTEIFVEREASPETLEEASEEIAVDRDTSPDALEDASEDNAVEREASAF